MMAYNYAPFAPWVAPYTNMMQGMQQTQQAQPQAMTPPTIHADIIQVAGEEEADSFPMAAGSQPQMMIKRDESEIYIKTMLANGQHELAVYPRRPPAPKMKEVDMHDYVTKDELEERLRKLTAGEKEDT